jgi:hypothetical protein
MLFMGLSADTNDEENFFREAKEEEVCATRNIKAALGAVVM